MDQTFGLILLGKGGRGCMQFPIYVWQYLFTLLYAAIFIFLAFVATPFLYHSNLRFPPYRSAVKCVLREKPQVYARRTSGQMCVFLENLRFSAFQASRFSRKTVGLINKRLWFSVKVLVFLSGLTQTKSVLDKSVD